MKGEDLKDAGIAKVAMNNAAFVSALVNKAHALGSRVGEITADDLRKWADEHDIRPTHPNAWGAVFRELGRHPRWQRTGFQKSRIPSNHARMISTWRYT